MRHRIPLLSLACAALAAAAAAAVFALARPNFTGTWELDQSKSHSVPQDMRQTMTVAHEGDRVSVETKIVTPQGERVVKDSYTLDGKEAEFTPQRPPNAPPDAPAPKGKRTARWMANDRGFLVEEEIINPTPQGPETTLVARKWVAWPDGTISIEIITERGGNAFNNKRVFVKKS
ncbi:MAG TPA: hypothetical protein VD968_14170 [Pyrinomonadaceae bacterium]|nr:hypothetical protein [Pyrinomonadaceae bacterium]